MSPSLKVGSFPSRIFLRIPFATQRGPAHFFHNASFIARLDIRLQKHGTRSIA